MRFTLWVFATVLFGCSSTGNFHNQIKVIEYSENERTTNPDSSIEDGIGSFKIMYSDDCTIYEVWSINYEVQSSKIVDKVIMNELVPTTDTTFKYFIIKKEERIGLMYDSLTTKEMGKKFYLDSLLERLTINRENMKIFELELGKAASENEIGNSKTVQRFYTKSLEGEADSIYRFYDEGLKNIEFSFAPKLDSINKSKLYKVQLIYLPKDRNNPRHELISEIKEVKISYSQKIRSLIFQFKKDLATLKF